MAPQDNQLDNMDETKSTFANTQTTTTTTEVSVWLDDPHVAQHHDGRLSFDRIDWRHAGNYTCWVENEAGGAHFSYRVDVWAAPQRIGVVVVVGQVSGEQNQKDESTDLISAAVGAPVFEVECVVVASPDAEVYARFMG